MITLQRLEFAAILLVLLFFYHTLGFSWVWFAILLLSPDVFMIGYLKDAKIGAHLYNLGHSFILPAVLLAVSLSGSRFLMMTALIWAIHICLDRALGFGLKHTTGFKDTHLGKL